jgi:hypothetical protein
MSHPIESFQWFVIPHGRRGADRALRFSVRMLPAIVGYGGQKLRDVPDNEAVCDWPAVLARGVELDLPGLDQRVPYSKLWREHLQAHGLTVEKASRLWRCIFDPATPIRQDPGSSRKVEHAFFHARLAAYTSQLLGQVLTDSLAAHQTAARRPGARYVPGIVPIEAARNASGVGRLTEILRSTTETSVSTPSRYRAPDPDDLRQVWATQMLPTSPLSKVLSGDAVTYIANKIEADAAPTPDEGFLFNYLNKRLTTAEDLRKPSAGYAPPTQDDENAWREFHSLAGSLLQHPWLLKVLGLVVNHTAPGDPDKTPARIGVRRVWFPGRGFTPRHLLETKVDPESWRALTRPNSRLHPNGCVNLGVEEEDNNKNMTPVFSLSQLDVDSGPEKLVQAVQSYRNRTEMGAAPEERVIQPGPQRTNGISLSERQPNEAIKKSEQLDESRRDGPDTWHALYAENLRAGYRPDVAA